MQLLPEEDASKRPFTLPYVSSTFNYLNQMLYIHKKMKLQYKQRQTK